MSGRITVRAATMELLRAFAMTTIFGNPGSTELTLFPDFPADFRYVLGLQESVVLAMADGYAQATRNAAFVNLHSAAGVGHALGNLFTAYRNRTPLVVTAGQQARSILSYQPFLYAAQSTEFPKPYVKYSVEPARAQDVPTAIAQAYYIAMQPPCGPTFVSVPIDDWDQLTDPIAPRHISSVRRADADAITVLGTALDRAKRPAFVVGASIDRELAWNEVVELAERHQARVFVAPMSARSSFPENHPLHAGFLPAMRERILEMLADHDLILVLGAPAFLYHVEGFGPHVPPGATLYQVTEDPDLAASTPTGNSIVANVKPTLAALLELPAPNPRPAPPRRPVPPRIATHPMSEAFVLQTLAEVRAPDSIIVEEAPGSRPSMHAYLPILESETFYTCASGGLGHALPASIGIAMGKPSKKVIALLGDGSSMYAIQGLYTAAQYDLPITFIIINNRGYRALHGFAKLFGLNEPVGTRLPGIDFVGLARAQGCDGMRVERAEDLHEILCSALAATRPTLVEVLVN